MKNVIRQWQSKIGTHYRKYKIIFSKKKADWAKAHALSMDRLIKLDQNIGERPVEVVK